MLQTQVSAKMQLERVKEELEQAKANVVAVEEKLEQAKKNVVEEYKEMITLAQQKALQAAAEKEELENMLKEAEKEL